MITGWLLLPSIKFPGPLCAHPAMQPPSYRLAQHGDGERETYIEPTSK